MNHNIFRLSKINSFELLEKADPVAIRNLAAKIQPDVRRLVHQTNLTPQDAEELLNDAIVITITAIQKGNFSFMDYHPAAYAVGVARKLIANRLRTQKPMTEDLEQVVGLSEFDPARYLDDKERQAIIQQLLNKMDKNSRQLIELKYFRHLKDKEIIEQQLTVYTSVASLKSKRSQCLKKLAVLARQAGITALF